MLIDNFNSGPHQAELLTGTDRDTQSGDGILNNLRNTWIGFIENPYNAPVTINVGSRGLIIGSGPKTAHRLEIAYGFGKGWTAGQSLRLDLRPFHTLRFRFGFNDLPLVLMAILNSETVVGPSSSVGVLIVERVMDLNVDLAIASMTTGADLANIASIQLILFPRLSGGSNDYTINSFGII